jgi:flagellar motor protein MotB
MAAKGGGAWKVAYADFVTAMMAFFLVMWICGQDQQVRKAVSYYFNDPLETSKIGSSKQPTRSGSVSDIMSLGSVPERDASALGQGRKTHTPQGEKGGATRLVSRWVAADDKSLQYWQDQARQARTVAAASREVRQNELTIDQAAVRQLAKRLRNELVGEIAGDTKGLQQELLFEVLYQVNWVELAEDLLSR